MVTDTFLKYIKVIDEISFIEGIVIECNTADSISSEVVREYYINEFGEQMNHTIGKLDVVKIALKKTDLLMGRELRRQLRNLGCTQRKNVYISEEMVDLIHYLRKPN